MSTCKGNHSLVVIQSDPQGAGIEEVIRWCERCGAIVGDVDADDRVSPGALFKMRFPQTELQKARGQ